MNILRLTIKLYSIFYLKHVPKLSCPLAMWSTFHATGKINYSDNQILQYIFYLKYFLSIDQPFGHVTDIPCNKWTYLTSDHQTFQSILIRIFFKHSAPLWSHDKFSLTTDEHILCLTIRLCSLFYLEYFLNIELNIFNVQPTDIAAYLTLNTFTILTCSFVTSQTSVQPDCVVAFRP